MSFDYFQTASASMAAITSFLAELDEAVARGNPESCLRALWHAADILIAGTYSEEQIWTFGEVIGRLAQEIEASARAKLAGKLACSRNAPYALTRQMASDDCIDVAWPVLSQSERLDTETLIACAKNKSQQHLLAISKRQTVPEAVTDVLVVRGSSEVVTSVRQMPGLVSPNADSCTWCGGRKGIRSSLNRWAFERIFPDISSTS
ncbi:uncharacterized protein (DUF2336 family) [Bradyrhizobium japonicum]